MRRERLMLKPLLVLSIVLGAAVPTSAQSTEDACKALPNGGKVKIEIPGVVGPPTCQACAPGFNIPANYVLGFTDRWRGTCELKNPQGGNTGLCKADTTCPPGTRKVAVDSVWGCQSPVTYREIDCPRITPPGGGPGGGLPRASSGPAVNACTDQLKAMEARLKQRGQDLGNALGADANMRGTAAATAVASYGEALKVYAIWWVETWTMAVPKSLAAEAACNNPGVDLNQPAAVAECNRAKKEWDDAVRRKDSQDAQMQAALKTGHKAVETAGSFGEPNTRTARQDAIKGAQDALDEAGRLAEACMGKLPKFGR